MPPIFSPKRTSSQEWPATSSTGPSCARIGRPWQRAFARKRPTNWDDTVAVDRLEGKGGRFVRGRGRLTAPDVVTVGDRQFRATRAIVLATGTTPAIPSIPGLTDTPYWTNHESIEATKLPGSIIVLGGGAIGADPTFHRGVVDALRTLT